MRWSSIIALALTALLASFAIGSSAAANPTVDQPEAITPLIVGGKVVPTGTKTYVVGLRNTADGPSFCGGSLVGPRHVLTAAHCQRGIRYVSIGTHYASGARDGERLRVVKQTPHPSYDAVKDTFDFLVLELERNSKFAPVAFGAASDIVAGKTATTIGWGATTEGGTGSSVLLSVDLPLVSDADCLRIYTADYTANVMVCAGGQPRRDSCQGDSGGPLVISKDGADALIGVVSVGFGCGQPNKPGIYARVPALLPWIQSMMVVTTPSPTTAAPTPPPTTAAPTPSPKPNVGDRCQALREQLCAELQCEWNGAAGSCSSYK